MMPPAVQLKQWERISMNQLLGTGVTSMAVGMVMMQESFGQNFDQGLQHFTWGAINTTIASLAIRGISKRDYDKLNIQERTHYLQRILGINSLLDVLYVGAGTALILTNQDHLMGHGRGILVQGSCLLAFDTFHYFRIRRMKKEILRF